MSRALLLRLNGDNSGVFKDWLDKHPWEPRVAWYPSCGWDFRDLLYLHKSQMSRRFRQLPEAPEIFIHTDCFMEVLSLRFETAPGVIYRDEWSTISILCSEELPNLEVSVAACSAGLSQFKASCDYGRVFFLLVQIESDRLGSILQPVVYAIVENGAFASQVLLETKGRITHLWNILPGDRRNPWLGYLLKRLKTECVIRDGGFYGAEELEYQRREYFALFPNLEGGLEDYPSSVDWKTTTVFQIKERTDLNVFLRNPSKGERDAHILNQLFDNSDSWKELKIYCGASFYNSALPRHGVYSFSFAAEFPDLYVKRQEIAEQVSKAVARKCAETYFIYELPEKNFERFLLWTTERGSHTCTFSKYCYPDNAWILEMTFTENGLRYIRFHKTANHSLECDFIQLEAVFQVLVEHYSEHYRGHIRGAKIREDLRDADTTGFEDLL